jgi:hypothetical protein
MKINVHEIKHMNMAQTKSIRSVNACNKSLKPVTQKNNNAIQCGAGLAQAV